MFASLFCLPRVDLFCRFLIDGPSSSRKDPQIPADDRSRRERCSDFLTLCGCCCWCCCVLRMLHYGCCTPRPCVVAAVAFCSLLSACSLLAGALRFLFVVLVPPPPVSRPSLIVLLSSVSCETKCMCVCESLDYIRLVRGDGCESVGSSALK